MGTGPQRPPSNKDTDLSVRRAEPSLNLLEQLSKDRAGSHMTDDMEVSLSPKCDLIRARRAVHLGRMVAERTRARLGHRLSVAKPGRRYLNGDPT